MTGRLPPHYSTVPNSIFPSSISLSLIKSLPPPGVHEENQLNVHSDMTVVVKAMANPESGLEVRDRMWLKITIPNAFIGENVSSRLGRDPLTGSRFRFVRLDSLKIIFLSDGWRYVKVMDVFSY